MTLNLPTHTCTHTQRRQTNLYYQNDCVVDVCVCVDVIRRRLTIPILRGIHEDLLLPLR